MAGGLEWRALAVRFRGPNISESFRDLGRTHPEQWEHTHSNEMTPRVFAIIFIE